MWQIEYGGVVNGFFTRNLFVDPTIDNVQDQARKHFDNKDMFHTIYLYDDTSNIANSNIRGPLILDLDGSIENNRDFQSMITTVNLAVAILEESLSIKERNIRIYFSGNKGFHLVINQSVLGLKDSKDLNVIYRQIAESIKDKLGSETLDMKIYDKRRLIRVSNSIHSKTGLHKVIITLDQLNMMTMDDMRNYASSPKEEIIGYYNDSRSIAVVNSLQNLLSNLQKKKNNNNKKKIIKNNKGNMYRYPCLDWLLDNGTGEGERNNASVALSSILMQNGYNKDETFDLVSSWNENKNEPPLSDNEILATVNSAYQMLEEGKAFGCNKLSEVSECSQNCKFYNSKQ